MKALLSTVVLVAVCLVGGCWTSDEANVPPRYRKPKAQQAEPVCGDIMVIGAIRDATVLLPVLAPDEPTRRLLDLVYSGLVKYDENVEIVGDLAERWEISEDQKRIRFFLRRGVKWHDGEPFTARDVEHTYKIYIDPKTPTPYASDFLRVRQFRVLDDHTVEVTYDKPYAPALGSWTEGILPKHLLEGVQISETPLARAPIGTGPYKFGQWIEGEKLVLEANRDYFMGRPYIDQVIIRFVLDKASAFLELKSGNLDMTELTPLQYKRQTASRWFEQNFNKYRYLSFSYTYLAYNLQDPKFRDKRVRRALTMGINRKRLVQGILLDMGQVTHAPYNPATIWYNQKVKRIPYHAGKARKLLEDAGWKDSDGDGILDKDGVPFEFTILTNQGDVRRKNAATIIQRDLSKIGIDVDVVVLEWAALLHHFLYKRNFEACLIGWALDYDPNQINKWNSKRVGPHDFNWMHYQNEEVDRLLELGVSTYDVQERKKYYDQFQQILAEDQPCTFLWVHDTLPIVHARFKGIRPTAIGIAYNFHRWFVPEGMQRYRTECGYAERKQ